MKGVPTRKNYFSQRNQMRFMGVSQFKAFLKCEAAALAELKGEYVKDKTDALLVGQYVDAYFDKTLDKFQIENPSMFTQNGTLKAPFKKADTIISRIEADPVMLDDYADGRRQVIFIGKIEGVPIKIKIDCLHTDRIVDGKIMRDTADIWDEESYQKLPFWKYYGYDIQAWWYQSVIAQNIGEKLPFVLSVATKENEPDLRRYRFTQETIEAAAEEHSGKIVRFSEIKKGKITPERCGTCDYCRATKKLNINEYEEI